MADAAMQAAPARPRHSAVVRVTHWLTAISVVALLVTGGEIVVSHPRFYWGEAGNVNTPALFSIPIPASRSAVQTGYKFVLPDQNGWSRYLHFQAAWLAAGTALLYLAYGFAAGHFRRNLASPSAYNPVQRLTYLGVVFVLAPLAIWTGLAMSPAVVSAVPAIVTTLGGQQSARTIHFLVWVLILIFLIVHVTMVWRAGFRRLVGAMITGREGESR